MESHIQDNTREGTDEVAMFQRRGLIALHCCVVGFEIRQAPQAFVQWDTEKHWVYRPCLGTDLEHLGLEQ